MYARIPVTITPAGNAQSALLSSDGYVVTTSVGVAFDDGYTTVRTLSAATADSEPPSSFVTLTGHTPGSFVEFMFNITALGGTVTADAVTFKIWRQLSNGYIDAKVEEFTISASDVVKSAATQLMRKIVPISASKVYVTCTFIGGTSPTITGQIYARPISAGAAGLQESDLSFDKLKNLNVVPPSYDGAANADRTIVLNDVSDKWAYEIPVDVTGTGLVTSNFDIDLRGYSGCTIHMSATSGTAGSLKFRFESIADIGSASPLSVPVTVCAFNSNTNSFLAPDYATQDITVSTVNTKYRLDYPDFGACILRIVVTVSSHASNVLKIVVSKKF